MHYIKTINEVYTTGKGQRIESNCFSIDFYNATGSNPVTINGVRLLAGEQYRVSQIAGCIDVTQYTVAFEAGAGTNSLTISRVLPI